MKGIFKYILFICAGIVVLSMIVVSTLPKTKLTLSTRLEIEESLKDVNSDLPRKIGTIGWLNSILLEDNSIVYNLSVNGDKSIDSIYDQNYTDFHTMILYSIVTLNGQQEGGRLLAYFLDSKGINMKCMITTPSQRTFEWNIPPQEMLAFVDSCKKNPTEALYTVIDMHVKLTKIQLPAVCDSLGELRTIPLNAISSSSFSADDILLDITHENNDIIIEYLLSEKDFSCKELKNRVDDEKLINALALELSKDEDFSELLNILALSHSNLILRYTGVLSKSIITVEIPYLVIRKYCKIPNNLLIAE